MQAGKAHGASVGPRAERVSVGQLGKRRRILRYFGLGFLVLAVLVIAIASQIEEPIRRSMEAELNKHLRGYSAELPGLDIHPFSFSLTLHNPVIRQQAHPDPPVMVIEELHAGVHWRALLSLRLVADFTFGSPRLHINRPQLTAEARDEVPVNQKGWQEALESIYPLKINEFRVNNGALTYIDDDPKRPLRLSKISLVTTNIRNIRNPEVPYPSPVHLRAVIFDKGRLELDGEANYLSEPQPTGRAEIDISQVPLERLKPVTTNVNVNIRGGILSARGEAEYGKKTRRAHLRWARIDEIAVDYVHKPHTAAEEARRVQKVEQVATELAGAPETVVRIDELEIRKAELGYIDQTTNPPYRVFLSNADITIRDISNQAEANPGRIEAKGLFMGSGQTELIATFMARRQNPQLELSLRIENTDLRALNDLFQAYGDFDVVAGRFSLYTQLRIANGEVEGYVKPFFADIDVYDSEQDAEQSLPSKIYEGIVGGISTLLENPRDEVATQATVKGSTTSPELSTWEVIINLIRNAFFKAILPGFEAAMRERR